MQPQNRKQNPAAPSIRFRDLPDFVNGYGEPESKGKAPEPKLKESSPSLENVEPANDTVDDIKEADLWEQEAGFDEALDKLSPGSGWGFEVTEHECIDLTEPALLDLPSDEPGPGVVVRSVMRACKRKASALNELQS